MRIGGETIDRASILSEGMLQCDKAKPALAESGPDLLHFGQNTLVVKLTRQGKQGQLHSWSYMEGAKKYIYMCFQKVSHFWYFSEKLVSKSACRDKITPPASGAASTFFVMNVWEIKALS